MTGLKTTIRNNIGDVLTFNSIREAATHINAHDDTIHRAYRTGRIIRDKSGHEWTVSKIEGYGFLKKRTIMQIGGIK